MTSEIRNVTYTARVKKQVPGLSDMHDMAGILLNEVVPATGRVLVVGAGGGMELKSFAARYLKWRFLGVDPNESMIELARVTLGNLAGRVQFHHGYLNTAPLDEFDGASCFLTLHFLGSEKRLEALQEIRRRLKPGAPFVVMHHSFPQHPEQRELWLHRNACLLKDKGVLNGGIKEHIDRMKFSLPALSPDEDVALFREAGFTDIQMFYAGFTYKGWVCYRSNIEL